MSPPPPAFHHFPTASSFTHSALAVAVRRGDGVKGMDPDWGLQQHRDLMALGACLPLYRSPGPVRSSVWVEGVPGGDGGASYDEIQRQLP
jgi:hypothetical protein